MKKQCQLKKDIHPCYSSKAHYNYYRLHLPVAPECNLRCNYCEKSIGGMSYHVYRPATTKEVLDPLKALEKVALVKKNTDKLKVVGIAGPGEPLANKQTFETFELIRAQYTDIVLCFSTNGILLSQFIEPLKKLGVQAISVTINSFEIKTLNILYKNVFTPTGEMFEADECACYVKEKQVEALECLANEGIQYKVNTILIPGVNDMEIESISRTIASYHASLHNIVPFIPLGELSIMGAPSYEDVLIARKTSGKYMKQFRLCKQCPSDVFDIPGQVKKECMGGSFDSLSDC
jgi:nitrogen fixation protein NifB